MVDIIDIANSEGKDIYIDNSKDYMELMKLAERKGYTWFSGCSPESKRYDKMNDLPILICFRTIKNRKYLKFTNDMNKEYIKYKDKLGNTKW
ncbi:hypothetical protein [Inconstantimicrobium porci]|uniref:hypothetical protein n=1 Tax=Inconstantimicrobium porci TaxID=2652291 RepID=UPI0024097C97|nr:hypothetical protein [Inconstantimicrobium porci]MDD6769669.1 hypothetical protein [Inconstantimicrobium porci]